MAPQLASKLYTTTGAARALRVSAEAVRGFVREGHLPCQRTPSGVRLFHPHDVLRLVDQRARDALRPTKKPPLARGGDPRQLRLRLFRDASTRRKVT
jgi:hypothetical protein